MHLSYFIKYQCIEEMGKLFRGSGRSPVVIATGLLIAFIVVSYSHWDLYNRHGVYTEKVSNLETQLEISSEKMEELTFRNDALKKSLNEMKLECKNSEALLKKKIQEETDKYSSCSSQLDKGLKMEPDLVKMTDLHNKAQAEIVEKDRKIKELEQLSNAKQADIDKLSGLQNEVASLKENINNLNNQLADKNTKILELQQKTDSKSESPKSQNQIKIIDPPAGTNHTPVIIDHGLSGVQMHGLGVHHMKLDKVPKVSALANPAGQDKSQG